MFLFSRHGLLQRNQPYLRFCQSVDFDLCRFWPGFFWKILEKRKLKAITRTIIGCAFVMFLLFDLLIFQKRIFLKAPQLPKADHYLLDSVNVSKLPFQPTRTLNPINERQRHAWELLFAPQFSTNTAIYAGSLNFVQFDSCDPKFRVDVVTERVGKLVSVPNVKQNLVGCYSPKLQLMSNSLPYNDFKEAAKLMNMIPDLNSIVLLRATGPEEEIKRKMDWTQYKNHIEVEKFSSNEILLNVDIGNPNGSWLIYKDAFHPSWRATVDGVKSRIREAHIAFKAVFLEKGYHKVHFFYSKLHSLFSISVALYGVFWALGFFVFYFREIFNVKLKNCQE